MIEFHEMIRRKFKEQDMLLQASMTNGDPKGGYKRLIDNIRNDIKKEYRRFHFLILD